MFFYLTTFFSTFAGITLTACPLTEDHSSQYLVEVFSAGWHQKSIFQRIEYSAALSIEFLPDVYDINEYVMTWLELARRPPVAEGIGKYLRHELSFEVQYLI